MEKKEEEGTNQRESSFKRATVLALLYYWTVGFKPDPIADLGFYGLSLADACDLISELVKDGWVRAFIHVRIPRRRYCDYETVDTRYIILNPEKFRETLIVTEDKGIPKLKKYMADCNLIDLLVRRR